MRLSKAALTVSLAQIILSVAGFVTTFAIAVLEGSTTLGQYAIAVSLGAFLFIIPMQAISDAVKKRMSEGEQCEEYLSAGVFITVAFTVVAVGTVLTLGVCLQRLPVPPLEIVVVLRRYSVEIAALVAAATTFRLVRDALEGTKRVGQSGILQAGERVIRTVVQVGTLLAGFGVGALVLGHGIAFLFASLIGVMLIKSRFRQPTRRHVRSLIAYARYAWLGTLRTRIFGWFDTFVLSFFVSASLIGIYEAAWGIAGVLGIVSLAIRRTLFPEVSDLSASDDYDRIRSILNDGLVFSGVFVIPGLAGALIVGSRILRFYRPEFSQGAGILVILICAYLAEAYGSQFISVINALDRPDVAYRVNLFFIIASIVLTTTLVFLFGWYGAAVATVSASVFRTILGYRALVGELESVPIPLAQIGRQLFAAAVMAVIIASISPFVPASRFWTIVLILAGAGIYVGVLLLISDIVRNKSLAFLS